MDPVKVGVLGLGTVGGGTVNVLRRNAEEIARRAGREISVVKASARDLSMERICSITEIELSTDPFDIVNDSAIEIVVESIGGESIAKELVLQAIANQ